MIRGFDVSAYDSATVPSADFVFVKATEGATYTSGRFAAQWASAKARARVRGAYHFARPERSGAASQADRFLAVVRPVVGEVLCLDLEASGLSQAATNAWAKAFGDRLRARAPGVATAVYLGSAYASSGTGRGLSAHFDLWWYPQYPSTAPTTTWPASFSPWLPSGITTGWRRPHIWQWTDEYAGSHDADVSTLTVTQLAAGDGSQQREDEMISGRITEGKGDKGSILCPEGRFTTLSVGWDNTLALTDPPVLRQAPAVLRVAMHQPGRKGRTEAQVTVGAPLGETTGWADNVSEALPAGCDRIDIIRLDDGDRPLGFCVY